MRKAVIHTVLLISFLISSICFAGDEIEFKPFDELEPAEVVELYYKSIGKGHYWTAMECLSEELRNLFEQDMDNIVDLSNVKIRGVADIKLYGKNHKEVQVVVSYDVIYKRVISEHSGKTGRFVYVGKKDENSPWRIIGIGTGP